MSNQFPTNPANNTVYELSPGVYYIYKAGLNIWNKIEGDYIPALATPVNAGLMSSDDYNKIYNIIFNPPNSSLTSEDTEVVFSSGVITINGIGQRIDGYDYQPFVEFDGTAKLLNNVAGIDLSEAEEVSRHLYGFTNSFDVYANVDSFYDYLINSNKFNIIYPEAKKGLMGDKGDDGLDYLKYGPKGDDGDSGLNAPYNLTLTQETINNLSVETRLAVIDIYTDEVSESENYLVVKRGIIGNPDAAPKSVTLGNLVNSTWLLAVPPNQVIPNRRSKSECNAYSGPVYYVDIDPILQEIEREFWREVETLKTGFERVVGWWLNVMSAVFDEQKSALCCALEYCKSQTRNTDTRRYIEQARLTAATNRADLLIDPDPFNDSASDLSKTVMQAACGDGFGTNNNNSASGGVDGGGGGGPSNTVCVPYVTLINGVPYTFDECPPGFTPYDIWIQTVNQVDATVTGSDSSNSESTVEESTSDQGVVVKPYCPDGILESLNVHISGLTTLYQAMPNICRYDEQDYSKLCYEVANINYVREYHYCESLLDNEETFKSLALGPPIFESINGDYKAEVNVRGDYEFYTPGPVVFTMYEYKAKTPACAALATSVTYTLHPLKRTLIIAPNLCIRPHAQQIRVLLELYEEPLECYLPSGYDPGSSSAINLPIIKSGCTYSGLSQFIARWEGRFIIPANTTIEEFLAHGLEIPLVDVPVDKSNQLSVIRTTYLGAQYPDITFDDQQYACRYNIDGKPFGPRLYISL